MRILDLRTRQRTVSVSVLVVSFLIALGFFLASPPPRVERTLFFPGAIERTLAGEVRLVPRTDSLRTDVETLVEELILGPVSISNTRALPRSAEVKLVGIREDTAYVDLSGEVVVDEADVNLTFDERIETVETSIRYNFRTIENVVVTIEGQVPYAPHYNLAESRN